MGTRAVWHLQDALESVIERHCREYKLSYHDIIAVLEVLKQATYNELVEANAKADDE